MTLPRWYTEAVARVGRLDRAAPWVRAASAGTLALVAALLAAWYLRRAEARILERLEPVEVVAASRTLRGSVPLRLEDLTTARLPRGALPGSALVPSAIPALVGRRLLVPLEAGDPILLPLVEEPSAPRALAADLPAGRRALAVPVEAASAVAGFVEPGDLVDVILVWQDGTGDSRAATLLEAVRVLAVGERRQPGGAPQETSTAVLDTAPREAEALLVALDRGRLALALRASGDLTRRPDRRPVALPSLLPGARAPVVSAPTVEVIRGVR